MRWLVLLAMLLGGISSHAAAQGGSPVPESFDGNYRFSESPAELSALEQELDRVADEFNVLIRAFARSELHDRVVPYPFVVIQRRGEHAQVRLGDVPAVLCDGAPHPIRGEEDEDGTGVCRYSDGRISIQANFDGAVRRTTIDRDDETGTLRVSVILEADQLPETVRFQATYLRR